MSEPIYTSRPSAKSLWSEYRIYSDRLELDTHLFGLIKVPFDELGDVEVRPPLVILDLLRSDHHLEKTYRALKIDLADLYKHVAVERETGLFRQLRLTPDDPEAFVEALRSAREAWLAGDRS